MFERKKWFKFSDIQLSCKSLSNDLCFFPCYSSHLKPQAKGKELLVCAKQWSCVIYIKEIDREVRHMYWWFFESCDKYTFIQSVPSASYANTGTQKISILIE